MKEFSLKKVNVLGIEVCDIRPDRGVALSLEEMHSHELNIVHFLTARGSNYCQETPWALNLVNDFNYVFPGDQHTEMAVLHKDLQEDNGFGDFAREYMSRFFSRLNRGYRALYVVTGTMDRLDALTEYLNKVYPNITISGQVYRHNEEGAADQTVNEINGHTPDAILLLLPPEEQYFLLRDYGSMMNAGLCICIESLQDLIFEEIKPVPGWIRFLHLTAVYNWLNKEEKLQSRIQGSLFKKRITEDAMADTEQTGDAMEDMERAEDAMTGIEQKGDAMMGIERSGDAMTGIEQTADIMADSEQDEQK